MAVLGKDTTYKGIIDIVRLRTRTIDDPKISDDLLIKEISLAVSKWAKILNRAMIPDYMNTVTLSDSITGSANPYNLDISTVSPFLSELIRVVHIATRTVVSTTTINTATVTSSALFLSTDVGSSISGTGIPSGTIILSVESTSSVTISQNATASGSVTLTLVKRTNAVRKNPSEAENDQQLSSMNATSLWYVHEGDSIKFYKGSSFTITIATDDVELKYFKQPIIASVTTASYPDILDSYTPTIVTEVTSVVKEYKDMPNDKELKQLENDYNAIMASFKEAA